MFLTPNCQKCATDIPKLRKEIADLLAIAIWTNSTDNPQDPNSILSHCDDVLYDNLNISALQKRIDFYFQQLKKNKETPQQQQHELARKNVKLTHQIAHLQKQLSQRDSNLQTREKVLDKNQSYQSLVAANQLPGHRPYRFYLYRPGSRPHFRPVRFTIHLRPGQTRTPPHAAQSPLRD